MKTIHINIYRFEELSDESQELALINQRSVLQEDTDLLLSIVDDCSLLEPEHVELVKFFGEDYDKEFERGFLIVNNRKLYCDLIDDYLDISQAMEIDDDNLFFKWLEIPAEMHPNVEYDIKNRNILFDEVEGEFNLEEVNILNNAASKFRSHCDNILGLLNSSYNYRLSAKGIVEEINENDMWFTSDGKQYIQ